MYLPQSNRKGLTLIELLVAMAVMAVTLLAVVGSFTMVLSKSWLRSSGMELAASLEYAKSRSIAVYEGQTYQLRFVSDREYQVLPDGPTRSLRPGVRLVSSPPTLTFAKRSGIPDQATIYSLTAVGLVVDVIVSETGVITTDAPRRP